jgi:uncharacterized YceG family protein
MKLIILLLSFSALAQTSFEVKVGERVSDWCKRLSAQQVLTCEDVSEVAKTVNYSTYHFLPAKGTKNRFEGMFRPGTYRVTSKQSPRQLIGRMLLRTQIFLAHLPVHESQLSLYDMSKLASIVEKEAASNKDYDLVATVFLNRLKKNDRLGSCPTVEYALGYHRPFLTRSDIQVDSPYNVYKRRGLPPTPISFFSDEAMMGVLNPATSGPEKDYYFFVYDWTTGELTFAIDYENHKDNANTARANYKRVFGDEKLYKKYFNLFYEMVK